MTKHSDVALNKDELIKTFEAQIDQKTRTS